MKTFLRKAISLAAILLISGCASAPKERMRDIHQALDGGRYSYSYEIIAAQEEDYGKRNQTLFNLNSGLLAHFGKDYPKSNGHLQAAEKQLADLYTVSLSNEVGAFIGNDYSKPFRGEDSDAAFIHIFSALNYTLIGDLEGALVEARRVDLKLKLLNDGYKANQKNSYTEDAFIRYFMGTLYAADDEINDAFISYQKAANAYNTSYSKLYSTPLPRIVLEDLYCMAAANGFTDKLEKLGKKFGKVGYLSHEKRSQMGEVVMLLYAGKGPYKIEKQVAMHMPDGYLMYFAFPKFKRSFYKTRSAKVILRSAESGAEVATFSTAKMEDINAISRRNLKERESRTTTKMIASTTTKYIASKLAAQEAKKRGGELAGLLTQIGGNILAVASTKADLRAWRTLPAEIGMGRAFVPPGNYTAEVRVQTRTGKLVTIKTIENIQVTARQKVYLPIVETK